MAVLDLERRWGGLELRGRWGEERGQPHIWYPTISSKPVLPPDEPKQIYFSRQPWQQWPGEVYLHLSKNITLLLPDVALTRGRTLLDLLQIKGCYKQIPGMQNLALWMSFCHSVKTKQSKTKNRYCWYFDKDSQMAKNSSKNKKKKERKKVREEELQTLDFLIQDLADNWSHLQIQLEFFVLWVLIYF